MSFTWFCSFSGPGAERQLRPIFREETPGEEMLPWGWGPCFPSFAPCQELGPSPSDHLHLAINCLAIVFSCLSQFPHSTCQGIFLRSYYPASYWPLYTKVVIKIKGKCLILETLEEQGGNKGRYCVIVTIPFPLSELRAWFPSLTKPIVSRIQMQVSEWQLV